MERSRPGRVPEQVLLVMIAPLYLRLRRDDLDSRFPGVLDAVIHG
jgi:hypothetical protein